jgi:hypothetical protein
MLKKHSVVHESGGEKAPRPRCGSKVAHPPRSAMLVPIVTRSTRHTAVFSTHIQVTHLRNPEVLGLRAETVPPPIATPPVASFRAILGTGPSTGSRGLQPPALAKNASSGQARNMKPMPTTMSTPCKLQSRALSLPTSLNVTLRHGPQLWRKRSSNHPRRSPNQESREGRRVIQGLSRAKASSANGTYVEEALARG